MKDLTTAALQVWWAEAEYYLGLIEYRYNYFHADWISLSY